MFTLILFIQASDQMKLEYLWDDVGQEFSAYSLNGKPEEVRCDAMIHLKVHVHVCACVHNCFLLN